MVGLARLPLLVAVLDLVARVRLVGDDVDLAAASSTKRRAVSSIRTSVRRHSVDRIALETIDVTMITTMNVVTMRMPSDRSRTLVIVV
jgi:hypothetical protein